MKLGSDAANSHVHILKSFTLNVFLIFFEQSSLSSILFNPMSVAPVPRVPSSTVLTFILIYMYTHIYATHMCALSRKTRIVRLQ